MNWNIKGEYIGFFFLLAVIIAWLVSLVYNLLDVYLGKAYCEKVSIIKTGRDWSWLSLRHFYFLEVELLSRRIKKSCGEEIARKYKTRDVIRLKYCIGKFTKKPRQLTFFIS